MSVIDPVLAEASARNPLLAATGLPPDEATGQFIGFARDGRAFVLQWSSEHKVWGAVGFEKHDYRPVVMALKDDQRGYIIAHIAAATVRHIV